MPVSINNGGNIVVKDGVTLEVREGANLNIMNPDSNGILIESGGTMNIDADVISLYGDINSPTGNGTIEIGDVTFDQYGAAPYIFYPADSTYFGLGVANTTYKWNENAGGTGVAGWKAKALPSISVTAVRTNNLYQDDIAEFTLSNTNFATAPTEYDFEWVDANGNGTSAPTGVTYEFDTDNPPVPAKVTLKADNAAAAAM